MIKDAIKYLLDIGKAEVVEVAGQQFIAKGDKLHKITASIPTSLKISTLTGVIDYIKKDADALGENLILTIESPTRVLLTSELNLDMERRPYVDVTPLLPKINFNSFMPTDEFNIMLQSCFVRDAGCESLLMFIGSLKQENSEEINDDGISQSVVAKTGVARLGTVNVPNPVLLAPYRTFPEVEQPASEFVFRINKGPSAGLFPADGGAWRLEAIKRIKDYLQEALEGCNVIIIA